MKSKAAGCGSISTVISGIVLLCVSSVIIIIVIIIITIIIVIIIIIFKREDEFECFKGIYLKVKKSFEVKTEWWQFSPWS